ncbi:M3 family oligoendopeptidase [uncultured Thomasclavelia sp.]|uniref:M3 family oligoendopeptidase n=1 Tax=uncultured Thomasclavelia sp. TaxID=3025759 RepID=UPI0025DDE175|nr:M3 family oligoendopeptidase [uncultured Thomasclavelia sp.]
MNEWNLDKLYLSFKDEKFINDFKNLEIIQKQISQYRNSKDIQALENYIKDSIKMNELIEKLSCYISLTLSVDTTNELALKFSDQLDNLLAGFVEEDVLNKQWIASFDLNNIDSQVIKDHLYILTEIQNQQKHTLDKNSESIIAHMQNTGSSAFAKLKDQVVSSIEVEIDNKKYPLTEVLNMAYDKDKNVRKKAYLAEIAAYQDYEQTIAACLNGIKGEVLYTTKLRGYKDELQRTLINSRMSKETLDVLLATMKENLNVFRDYLKIKAQHLGYQNGLPWYELYAPVVNDDSQYPYLQGCQFVVEQFNTFSKHLGDFALKAINENWIDVYPHSGKVGGAFCCNLQSINESRFLLNYGNNFSDVITMAHELGHGFHGECLKNETILNSEYPMPIAETASTFCETIVTKAALKNADNKTKLALLEDELSGATQVIVDIYSRYLFEANFFEKRKTGALSVLKIKELMLQAQKEAYGDGLDPNYLHPYMWTWKPHYYDAGYSFYNFPYAFGLLLAKGLYSIYLNNKSDFATTYEKLLSLTGKMDLEDVCLNVGIDLKNQNFWQASIDTFKEDIELYRQLLLEV